MQEMMSGAAVDTVERLFTGPGGKWAAEQFKAAVRNNQPLTPALLRTNDTLRHDEWRYFDEVLIAEAQIRLVGVADLISRGLVRNVPNAMGKTVYNYELVSFMDPATVSMDGVTRSNNDRQEFSMLGLPLPITHKDFYLNLRTLQASRNGGEGLDTTQISTSGRVVSEMAELMLFQGSKTFAGLPIYGYMTHPKRKTVTFVANGNWANGAKTGVDFLNDLLLMMKTAQTSTNRMNGPYMLYISRDANNALDADFKANVSQTIRQRLLQVDGLLGITVADQLPSGNVILVQMTPDVVVWVQGEPLQTVQWDTEGGFHINYKAFQIAVPLIRADIQGRSGIVHMA